MKEIKEIAKKFSVSEETVQQLLSGLQMTGGNQVQFNIFELGGMGQWQTNGMIMIGDMFNNGLKDKVNRLCIEIAELSRNIKVEKKETPATEKGRHATIKGSQNAMSYAYYPSEDILEIESEGKLKKYNTKGLQISGVQQSQDNGGRKLSFSHSKGTVELKDLEEVKVKKPKAKKS